MLDNVSGWTEFSGHSANACS